MKHFFIFSLALIFLIATSDAYAQSNSSVEHRKHAGISPAKSLGTNRPLVITENKGQVTDQYGKPRTDIQYKTGNGNVTVFIGNGVLHYQFSKVNSQDQIPRRNCRTKTHLGQNKFDIPHSTQYDMYWLDMSLAGANAHATVIAEDGQAYYENYYTSTVCANARAWGKVTYKDIYPQIDWVLYIKNNKLEYDFIVHPGGNVNNIQIKYNGATEIAGNSGNIKISTPFGDISEGNLYAYTQNTHRHVAADFKLKNNTLAFSLPGQHKRTESIVIDPTLTWGTYFGGEAADIAFGVSHDDSDNIYIAGLTYSVSNIATAGAHQTVYSGARDAFVAKFNGWDGNILWASYYGGSSQDVVEAITTDKYGNSYITGQTSSTNNIATPGSYQPVLLAGAGDGTCFLAKFDSHGALQWGTYYGGGNSDDGRAMACDTSGNIYICGSTGSAMHIATPGSFQDTVAGPQNCGFLAKFNNNGNIIWATYFGGADTTESGDAILACACDNANNVYIAGVVESTSSIFITPGCYQDTSGGGGGDAFLTKFDSNGVVKWSTYFGSDSGDYAEAIVCDNAASVYMAGSTYSHHNIATPGSYQASYGGGEVDAFVVKFNDTGAIQWASYFGGNNADGAQGIASDDTGNIYITGYTGSTVGIAIPGSYQDGNGGLVDAFLARFSTDGACSWATYYGSGDIDNAYGMTADRSGIYIAGATKSLDNIATDGTFQTDNYGGYDAFLAKFSNIPAYVQQAAIAISALQLYPSPNNGVFTMTGNITGGGNFATIDIIDIAGRTVYSTTSTLQNGKLTQEIALKDVASGVYIITVETTQGILTKKMIIE